jgi:hypothetical protein
MTETTPDHERSDLRASLAKQRGFLCQTVAGLTDAQAALRTTPSELCLGGVIKHVAYVEQGWAEFIRTGESRGSTPEDYDNHANSFKMLPGETLTSILDGYRLAAESTDELVSTLASLDISHPLPEAPWFPPGTTWSARTVLLHILAETAQHAGHADIIREALDGAKTMG